MKLILADRPAPTVPGGVAMVLCDAETGEQLPCQEAVEISQEVGMPTRVTVRFSVDGKDIRMTSGNGQVEVEVDNGA